MNILPQSPVVRKNIFNTIKYLTYGLLAWNGYMFYVDESLASTVTFSGGLDISEIIKVYSGSLDTTFWILLVILLELETYVIEDHVLKRPVVKWSMIGARTICYAMIVYALYGYIVKMMFQSDMIPLVIANACDLVGQNFSILVAIEDYLPLTAENCGTLAGADLYQLNGYQIIAPLGDMIYARNVSWIDVVNASTWLGIVAILEVDVWYQLKGGFTGLLLKASKISKIVLYTILFGCAVAWGYTGVLLDFGDAAVWLFAFFFIEMNLFQWQQETELEAAAT
ncbi:MAG: hypothetical protein V3R64_07400 [Sphingomonadales bacterium]